MAIKIFDCYSSLPNPIFQDFVVGEIADRSWNIYAATYYKELQASNYFFFESLPLHASNNPWW